MRLGNRTYRAWENIGLPKYLVKLHPTAPTGLRGNIGLPKYLVKLHPTAPIRFFLSRRGKYKFFVDILFCIIYNLGMPKLISQRF